MILGKDNLDDLLRAWPAPEPGAAAAGASTSGASPEGDEKDLIKPEGSGHWEAWAEVIVKAAVSAGPTKDPAALDALLGAPLLHEPGEPGSIATVSVSAGTGEIKMSQENDPGATPSAEPSSPAASVAPVASSSVPERKRSSLKAFAEKASVRPSIPPAAVSSAPSTATPLPAAVITLPPGRLSRPGPAPVSRPAEAGADDSGMVNLNAVKESATPQQIAAAEAAKPGTADLFEDDAPAPAAKAEGAKVIPITAAKADEPKKSNNGAIAGIAIALLGVAAAFGIMKMQNKPEAAAPVVSETKPAVAEPKPAPTATEAAPAPTAVAAVDTAAPAATAEPDKGDAAKVAALATGGPLPSGVAVAAKDPAAEKAAALALAAKDKNAPAGKPGDLQSEMAKAVGATDGPKGAHDGTPEPAAANPKLTNVPEQPSQGSVQGAIGAVMGGAKACVAGADDVSRAQVTFSSAGTVSNVSVTGWAAAHGKSGCVSAALKAAKCGPFSKPSFTVGVTIRP